MLSILRKGQPNPRPGPTLGEQADVASYAADRVSPLIILPQAYLDKQALATAVHKNTDPPRSLDAPSMKLREVTTSPFPAA